MPPWDGLFPYARAQGAPGAGCAAAFDLTELPDTGSLYDGGDAIEASERLCAEAFGAGRFLLQRGRVHPVYPDHAASRLRRGRRTDPDGAQRPSQCGEYRCFAGAGAGLAVAGIWRRPWLPAGSGKLGRKVENKQRYTCRIYYKPGLHRAAGRCCWDGGPLPRPGHPASGG